MRDHWYADNRDFVKWSVLLTLAQRTHVHHILQVLYHRPSTQHDIDLDRDGARDLVPIPTPVIRHFRDAVAIRGLKSPVRVEVISDLFANRAEYLKLVITRIKTRKKRPGIVFLDPDTGLQPKIAKPEMEHVLETELKTIWDSLYTGDTLVLYQHQTNRKGEEWMGPKREQFEKALGLRPGDARVACSLPIARDVAFIYALRKSEKGDEPES